MTDPPTPLAERQLLTVEEARAELGCSKWEIREMLKHGMLRHWRRGRRISIPRSAIAEVLDGGNMGAAQTSAP